MTPEKDKTKTKRQILTEEGKTDSLRRKIKDLKTKSKKSKHKKLLEEKKRLFQYKGERIPPCEPLSHLSPRGAIEVVIPLFPSP